MLSSVVAQCPGVQALLGDDTNVCLGVFAVGIFCMCVVGGSEMAARLYLAPPNTLFLLGSIESN